MAPTIWERGLRRRDYGRVCKRLLGQVEDGRPQLETAHRSGEALATFYGMLGGRADMSDGFVLAIAEAVGLSVAELERLMRPELRCSIPFWESDGVEGSHYCAQVCNETFPSECAVCDPLERALGELACPCAQPITPERERSFTAWVARELRLKGLTDNLSDGDLPMTYVRAISTEGELVWS